MRRKLLIQFILITLLLFMTACGTATYDNTSSSELPAEFYYKETVKGINFTVGFDKESYKAGEDIVVTAMAENVSGSNITVCSDNGAGGKNSAIQIDSYIDGEPDYISNSRDFETPAGEYEGVLENKESIRNRITFYTDTLSGLTDEDSIELCVYLDIINGDGIKDTISIMVPVNIMFD